MSIQESRRGISPTNNANGCVPKMGDTPMHGKFHRAIINNMRFYGALCSDTAILGARPILGDQCIEFDIICKLVIFFRCSIFTCPNNLEFFHGPKITNLHQKKCHHKKQPKKCPTNLQINPAHLPHSLAFRPSNASSRAAE